MKKQMEKEKAEAAAQLKRQKEEFETKIQTDKATEEITKQMAEIKTKVAEANQIAEFFDRDIIFSEKFV
jgi:hypothetical protein